MRRLLVLLCGAVIMSVGATASIRCPAEPTTITIEVFNDTPVAIQSVFSFSADPNIGQDDLLATGDLASVTVGSGLVSSFDLSCQEAAALILDRADLLVTGGGVIGTNILYQDLDYFCGEILTFTFTSSEDLTVLDVEVTFQEQ